MTALADALLTAQRQAIAALEKAYVAGLVEFKREDFVAELDGIGCTDKIEQAQLVAALDLLRIYGAPAPKAAQPEPKPESEKATEAQLKYAADLARDKGVQLPAVLPASKASASKLIEELKAGTYDADAWDVPF